MTGIMDKRRIATDSETFLETLIFQIIAYALPYLKAMAA